jgi:chemotaxis protein MotB
MIFRRLRRAKVDGDEVPEYWITYSDLMVSLLMTFALLLFLAMAKVQADVKNAERIIKANRDAITLAGGALTSREKGVVIDSATGTLIMNSELLFDYGSARLKPAAMTQIQGIATEFLPKLIQQPSVDSLLQEIVVEGHTDTVGTYLSNLQLSQQRAYSVMNALVESTYGMGYAPRLRSLIVASGKSEMRPVFTDGEVDAAKSRRIEIHLRFRDDAILKTLFESINTSPKD